MCLDLLCAAVSNEAGKERTVREPRRIADITADLARITPGWPKSVGGKLFIWGKDDRPSYLPKTPDFFAWLHRHADVFWQSQGEGVVTKEEFFANIRVQAEAFRAVESLPHWPMLPDVFYMHGPIPEPAGKLDGMLDRFSPATPIDRELIKAFVLTGFWGGPPGKRPAFLATGIDKEEGQGRGIGKSTLFDVIAQELLGGYLDVSPNDDINDIKKRILSGEGCGRIGRIDNLKMLRFSWAELEGMITSPLISGHEMYVGNRSVPNLLTWTITVNGASLSKDMALRCVIIKLARPAKPLARWEEDLRDYIQRHRWEIIAEVGSILAAGVTEVEAKTRWAKWEQDVLAHVADPGGCAAEIRARQGSVDEGNSDRDVVAELFAETLRANHYAPDSCHVFIPSVIAAEWVSLALRNTYNTSGASAKLKEIAIPELTYFDRQRKFESRPTRGWVWRGKEAQPARPEDAAIFKRLGG